MLKDFTWPPKGLACTPGARRWCIDPFVGLHDAAGLVELAWTVQGVAFGGRLLMLGVGQPPTPSLFRTEPELRSTGRLWPAQGCERGRASMRIRVSS